MSDQTKRNSETVFTEANEAESPKNGEAHHESLARPIHEEILMRLSEGLHIPEKVTQAASVLISDLITIDAVKDDKNMLCTCLLYSGLLDFRSASEQTPDGQLVEPIISATNLLSYANVTVTDFLTKMHVLREYHQFSPVVLKRLTAVERKFLIVSPLFIKFEKIFDELFLKEDDPTNPTSATFSEKEGFNFKKKLCWMLFIYAKAVLMKGDQELVTAFHLLLSCLDYVVNATPSFELKPPFDFLRQSMAPTLPQLCVQYGAKREEVESQESSLLVILQNLPQGANMLDVWRLEDAYTELYRREGDLDEVLFLSYHRHLMDGGKSPSSQFTNLHPPETPVSAALNTVQQLQNLLSFSLDRPSDGLLAYFSECPTDPAPSIEERLGLLRSKFVAAFVSAMGQSHEDVGHKRFTLVTRLYYRIMESLLKMEETRLQCRNFPHLLHSNIFHASLCACAVIVVMASYTPQTLLLQRHAASRSLVMGPPLALCREDCSEMAFPWILNVFSLKGYDFYKMIESFIKAEPKLTKDIIKHLQDIENKVLESIAWESSSPLYRALVTSASPPVTLQTPEGEANTPTSDLFISPVRGVHGSPYDAHDSPKSPTPRRSHTLNNFFNKVCRLSYHRLQNLCTQLDIPNDVQQKIWTCLEYCLSNYWSLMRDRHIDQMMMCAVYSICRVQDMEIKFKRIVSVYSTLAHASLEVYKHVLIQGTEYSSIITFYNAAFMPTLKSYILQFADAKQIPSMSPVPKSVPSPLTASPVYGVPGRKNFFVSPMKESPFKPPLTPGRMTPRTRQLYSFGEGLGSAEKLKVINESMRSAQRLTSPIMCRSQKRLQFDKPADATSMASDEPGNIIVVKRTRKSLKFDGTEPVDDSPASTLTASRLSSALASRLKCSMATSTKSPQKATINNIKPSSILALNFDESKPQTECQS